MEQLYFTDIAVGPTLYSLLKSARRRFMRFEFVSNRKGTKQFEPGDGYGFAHMPAMATEWVVAKQTNDIISTALTELYNVNFSNLDHNDKSYIYLNMNAVDVRNGLKQYLATCLTWMLLRDDEVYLIAHERFSKINSGSLDNYGCNGKKICKIQALQITRVEGEGVCCAGRKMHSSSHPCERPTSYKIVINKRRTDYTCNLCFRWFFSEQQDTFGLWK